VQYDIVTISPRLGGINAEHIKHVVRLYVLASSIEIHIVGLPLGRQWCEVTWEVIPFTVYHL